ncbi:MAG: DUF2095 family protein [Candidatus Helarchaeota archaeon]
MIEEDEEEFKKKFPHLAKEILEKRQSIPISSIRSEQKQKKSNEDQIYDELRNPDVISFIRRADTEEQAMEIIDYCLKRGEIDEEYAKELKNQLSMLGVRSFGPKKEPGYYEKKYRKKDLSYFY